MSSFRQYSLRSLFILIAVVAGYLAVAVHVGWFEGTVEFAAVGILMTAIVWSRWHLSIRFAAGIIALATLWFFVVDWSWFVWSCPHCMLDRDIGQVRLLHQPIQEHVREWNGVVAQGANDLGVPCTHQGAESWHKHRRWGLIVCRDPCINGTIGFSSDLKYDEAARGRLLKLVEQDPGLPAEFQKRVLANHDWAFWHQIALNVFPGFPPNSNPSASAPSSSSDSRAESSEKGCDCAGQQ